MTTVEISAKAQVILSWLKDPTTKRYINKLLEEERSLQMIGTAAMEQAVNDGFVQRSEDEIRTFRALRATRTLLSNIPYEASLKEEVTKEDVEELENFFEQLPN